MEDPNGSSFVGECMWGGGGGGPASCSSLDSCRSSGIAMCLSYLDVFPPAELPWWLSGLECWPCKLESAGSLL